MPLTLFRKKKPKKTVNFDAPDRAACVVARGRTNTPLQALTLLNDPAYIEAAFGFYGLEHGSVMRGTAVDDELGRRAGTHQIPLLETPEGWALADTTPILALLDARVPARRLFRRS